ncbi:phosphate transport system regulatory protein PhoU [Brachybacterium vulturis]|uniref:Phosphate-specific transport system accessory protein PhoU n=1 Tax=Brachybacterium vulturis TaxID=2017484 RepID=A0A291GQM6_9MICO|nr:phosphate signaling complex protein PhoU [Brachybacterium vulturis]ATG52659.1 phosphate transport system regulatory protein PhoU [Brachybacterium vulturis]
MREAYQSDLRHIVDDLVDMAEMVGTALDGATSALLEGELALAERVVTADPHLDARQLELDAKAVELLARQAPVATDLRLLVATLRMSSSLERMGDLAAHVALVARRAHPEIAVPAQHREQIARMSELGLTALRTAAQVIQDRDLALAAQVEKQDDELDELMLTISREISRSDEDTYTNAQVIDLTLLIRFYERIGDHAVSLVRRVGFLVTGDSLDTLSEGVDVQEF